MLKFTMLEHPTFDSNAVFFPHHGMISQINKDVSADRTLLYHDAFGWCNYPSPPDQCVTKHPFHIVLNSWSSFFYLYNHYLQN